MTYCHTQVCLIALFRNSSLITVFILLLATLSFASMRTLVLQCHQEGEYIVTTDTILLSIVNGFT